VIIQGFIPEDQVKRFKEEIQPVIDSAPCEETKEGIAWIKRCRTAVTDSATFRMK
jgi:hypothetical protein